LERLADARKEGCFVKLLFMAAAASVITPSNVYAATSESARDGVVTTPVVQTLDIKEKQQFGAIYSAIHSANWAEASRLIDGAPKGPMASMARAELYLAPNSPHVESAQLQALLQAAPFLPQAEQLERMALKRGAENLPQRPGTQRFSYRGSAPKRDLPDNITGDGIGAIRDALQISIRNDDPAGAEAMLIEKESIISDAARNELRYRIAWSYYIENDDQNARRMAASARSGGGDWAVQANWTYGLASWRLKDYSSAFAAFDQVSRSAGNDELKAASLFWSARAATASRQPQQVQARLQNAAQFPETFYGLLASEALGMEPLALKQAKNSQMDWNAIKRSENVQIAVGLSQIGENKLADEALRFQARIGDADKHGDLAQLAGQLNLPATQLWMGHYGPSGERQDALMRYPTPSWQPTGGWRIDPSLAFAHSLQESQFRTDVVSPAGARGLMQVRPGTANDMARARGNSFTASDLDRPSVNLEYGQSYIERLRDSSATSGLLPKVIAAYNAGPTPIARWNTEIHDNGDPLLYVESIPYWETRGYVSIILRNYWIYQIRDGKNPATMTGIAQYLWPRFPNANGASLAVRENSAGLVQTANGGTIAAR
jgi:soluble lytic murein transglycosylase